MKKIFILLMALSSIAANAQSVEKCAEISDLGNFCVTVEEDSERTVKLVFPLVYGELSPMIDGKEPYVNAVLLYRFGINLRGGRRLDKICKLYGFKKHVRGTAITQKVEWDDGAVDVLKNEHDSDVDVSGIWGVTHAFTALKCYI